VFVAVQRQTQLLHHHARGGHRQLQRRCTALRQRCARIRIRIWVTRRLAAVALAPRKQSRRQRNRQSCIGSDVRGLSDWWNAAVQGGYHEPASTPAAVVLFETPGRLPPPVFSSTRSRSSIAASRLRASSSRPSQAHSQARPVVILADVSSPAITPPSRPCPERLQRERSQSSCPESILLRQRPL